MSSPNELKDARPPRALPNATGPGSGMLTVASHRRRYSTGRRDPAGGQLIVVAYEVVTPQHPAFANRSATASQFTTFHQALM